MGEATTDAADSGPAGDERSGRRSGTCRPSRESTSRCAPERYTPSLVTTAPASPRSSRSSRAWCAPTAAPCSSTGSPPTSDRPRMRRSSASKRCIKTSPSPRLLISARTSFWGGNCYAQGILGRLGFVDRAEMRRQGMAHLTRLGTSIPSPSLPLESMSGGQKQAVAVARAAVWGQRVLILDEPAAALGVRQTAQVLDLVRRSARDGGLGIIFISHNVPQVLDIADRITVLRQGRVCLHCKGSEATVDLLGPRDERPPRP